MSEKIPDKVVDCSGLKCPMPLAKTIKAVKELQAGQVLEMISTDPGTELDLTVPPLGFLLLKRG